MQVAVKIATTAIAEKVLRCSVKNVVELFQQVRTWIDVAVTNEVNAGFYIWPVVVKETKTSLKMIIKEHS